MKTSFRFKVKPLRGMLTNLVPVLGILLVSVLLSSPVAADSESGKRNHGGGDSESGKSNPCDKTAKDISTACNAGAEDAYWLAIATCDNMPTSEERKACSDQAKKDRKSVIDECKKQYTARLDICQSLGGGIYHPVIDPADFDTNIDNPYYPLTPGTTFIYEGITEKGNERDEVKVTKDTKTIIGVTCVVVHDTVYVDNELAEETLDWYAQDKEGNVWYFGENSRQYAGGEIVSIDGSWQAGINGAQPGIIMEAKPKVGDIYRQEFAPGEAEDMGEVLSLTESTTVPFGGLYANCLMTKDFSGLEPDVIEHKYFAKGVGFIQALDVNTNNGIKLINIIK